MNHCKSEKMEAKEYGKMLKRIVILEEGMVPDRKAKGWKVEEEKRRVTRKECTRLREEFEAGGFVAQKVCGTLPTRKCRRTEEPCPKKMER